MIAAAIIAFRIFIASELIYLSVIGTKKLIWMRRVCIATDEHTTTLKAHTKKMNDLAKQIAYAIERLNPQPTPPGKLGPQLVEKKARNMARIAKGSENLLLEEDSIQPK